MLNFDSDHQKISDKSKNDAENFTERFKPFNLSKIQEQKYYFGLLCDIILSKRERFLKQAQEKALNKLNNSLDIRTILSNQRAFRTLLTLILSRTSQKLIYLQRKQFVIETT